MAEIMSLKKAADYLGMNYDQFLIMLAHPMCKLKTYKLPGRKRPMIRRQDIDKFVRELEEY